MKKILFLDRDNTLVVEPPLSKQINSLAEMEFLPNVISSLKRLSKSGFELVMVTNQDGLGTDAYPKEIFDSINHNMFLIFASEEIHFAKVFTCAHFKEDNCTCRKPKIGLVEKYLHTNIIDYENSYMVGDRKTDLEFAKNIGITGFLLKKNVSWVDIADKIILKPRIVEGKRKTNETSLKIRLNLDGRGRYKIDTQIKFFDHMLAQLSKHSGFDLEILAKGDVDVDQHHTIEDTALLLGELFKKALGDKIDIVRFAYKTVLVMDEAKSEIAIDLSGRPFLVFQGKFEREYISDFPTEMVEHFFQSFCSSAGINLWLKIKGKNSHHMIESSFKALAYSLRKASRKSREGINSTKGVLS